MKNNEKNILIYKLKQNCNKLTRNYFNVVYFVKITKNMSKAYKY